MPNNKIKDKIIPHKILFFFMPESIVFGKPSKYDDVDIVALKSISPCFYWCSAHEFTDTSNDSKYLFQYQIYSIEGGKILADEIDQRWFKNKNQVRESMISFIDSWQLHNRILMNPEDDKEKSKDYYKKVYDFNEFAQFVGESIFKLQKDYLEQSTIVNFDLLQKEYWKMMAINNIQNDGNYNTVLKNKKNIDIKKKIKKSKTQKDTKKYE